MDTMHAMVTYPEEIEQLIGVKLTPKAYQVVLFAFNYNGWKPFYPLSLPEIWKCVWAGCSEARHASLDELISLIEKGYFYVPYEISHAHNTLRRIHEEYKANH